MAGIKYRCPEDKVNVAGAHARCAVEWASVQARGSFSAKRLREPRPAPLSEDLLDALCSLGHAHGVQAGDDRRFTPSFDFRHTCGGYSWGPVLKSAMASASAKAAVASVALMMMDTSVPEFHGWAQQGCRCASRDGSTAAATGFLIPPGRLF